MAQSISQNFPNVAFGTSGLRALVTDLSPHCVHAYVTGFIAALKEPPKTCYIAFDFRPSSPEISTNVMTSLRLSGVEPISLGQIPTPALALTSMAAGAPAIMITGSHIPFDRNGIKFYLPSGEIEKSDETAISEFPNDKVDYKTFDTSKSELLEPLSIGRENYLTRALSIFPNLNLAGKRIGIYQHSAVGRDLLVEVFEKLGAEVIALGRSDKFIPIDTEAVSEADLKSAREWTTTHQLDALFSTDGDSDRPWVCDENGAFIRGDILGILTAREIGANAISAPVNVNTSLENTEVFDAITRTRIGSPYVIEGMQTLSKTHTKIAGYEANGGFLVGDGFENLAPLPTRDSLLPMLAILNAAQNSNQSLSQIVNAITVRFTHSDRLQDTPRAQSLALIENLQTSNEKRTAFFKGIINADLRESNTLDGLRMIFKNGEVAHLRPSGNAPELRIYAEAKSQTRAEQIVSLAREKIPTQL